MKKLILIVLVFLIGACDTYTVDTLAEEAVVIGVQCEKRTGQSDCVTTVQFPDRSVRARVGWWGNTGDTILAVRVVSNRWEWTSP